MRKPYRTARPNPRLLEPRMVFDGAAADTAVKMAVDTDCSIDLAGSIAGTESLLMQQSQSLPVVEASRQIAFVDAALLKDGSVPGLAAGVELVALQPDADGIAQIGAALAGRSDVSAIYIVSHGGTGSVSLGSTELSNATLAAHAADIASWAPHLSADADILLYGCQVGSGGEGLQLLQSMADLTGADIAASTNNTGPASLGGDWMLEASTGAIEAQGFASADALAQFDALLNVSIGSNSLTGWIAVTPANNQNDATSDQQTGSGSVSQDIVGDATYRAAYVKYDNGGTAGDLSDDWLAFRVRVNNQDSVNPSSPSFKNFAFFGVDADGNGSIDFFAGVYNPANNSGRIGVYDANGAGNTGPSDTGINGTPAIKYDSTTTGYASLYSVLATGDGSNFSGDTDYFVTFQVKIADINASKATFGLTNNITQSTVMRYIVGTAAQDNSFNQDVSGITGGYMSSTLSWTQLGAYTAPLQTDGSTPLAASADYASATEKGGTANGTAGVDPTGNLLTNDSGTGITVTKVQSGLTVGASANTVTASSTSTLNATTVNGSYGTLTIGADGSYSYAVNNGNTTAQALRTSTDTLTDTFSYRITDSAAGTSDATLTVTLRGADDAPVITSGSSGSIAENASTATAIYTVAASDVDTGDTKAYSLKSGVGDEALFSINAGTGVVTLKSSANYEAKSSYTFTVIVTDTAGLTDEKAVTVSVTNVNEAPVAANDTASATEKGGTANGTTGVDPSGNVLGNDSDVDAGDTKAVSVISFGSTTGTVGQALSGSYGSLTLNADGSYSYAVNNANTTVQALRTSGDTLTETFSYTMRDTAGQTSTATLVITIRGADDAPVITSGSSGSIAENAAASNVIYTVAASDVDGGDTKTYSLKSGTGDESLLNINSSTGAVTLKASADYESKSSYSFTVVATDTAGLSDEKAVTVSVTNVNEAPVATNDTALATEKGGTANGTVGVDPSGNVLGNDTDVDAGDTKAVSAVRVGSSGTVGTVGQSLAGSYGSLTLNADGSYSYAVNNANATVQALRTTSDTLTETYSYTMRDAAGLTATSTLTITIHGANDAPVASAVSTAGATVGEAMTPVTVPAFADVDNAHLTYAATLADGSALPTWLAFDAATRTFSGTPPIGSVATLSLRVTGSDGSLSDHVDFDLVVSNPAAPQAADDAADATEAGGIANGTAGSDASGAALANDSGSRVTVTRVDAGNALGSSALSVSAQNATDIAGSHGHLSLHADGSFAYEVANGDAAVQALNVGDTLSDTFSYEVTDQAGQTSTATITIAIHGANDAPHASSLPTSAATNGQPMTPLTVPVFSDVDNATLSYSATLSDGSPLPSWLDFDTATRTFSGTPPSDFTGTIGICVTGDDGAADAKLHFNLVVVNPGAPVAFDDSGSATESGAAAGSDASGELLLNDAGTSIGVSAIMAGNQFTGSGTAVNAGSTLAGGATQVDGRYGTLFIAADGGYRYELRNALPAVDALNAGDTLSDSFAYQINDPSGQVATALLTISIDGANDAPVASAVSTAGATVGEAMTPVTVPAFADVDNAHLTYAATLADGSALPTWLAFDAATRTFSGTPPVGSSVGTLSLRVTGSDGSLSDHADFDLVVSNPAGPQAANDAADATEAGGIANGTAGSDASGNALANDSGAQVTITHASAGNALASGALQVGGANATDIAGGHGTLSLRADGSFSYRVADGDAAVQALNVGDTLTDTFSYEVSDHAGQTSTATITITIHGANDAPVASAISTSPVTGGSAMPAITVPAFADVDNTHLNYTATLADGSPLPSWLSFDPTTRTFSGTPPASAATLALRVSGDDGRASDSVSFSLVINAPAQPQPEPVQPPIVVAPVVAAPVILPPAPPVTIPVPVDAPRVAEPTPIARATTSVSTALPLELGKLQPVDQPGPMDDLYTDSRGFRVVVMPSNVQELSVFRGISDQFVERGSDVKFNLPQDAFVHARPDQVVRLSARQADGAPLPAWLQFDASNGSFIGTPPKDFRGEVRISVVARDGAGHEAAALFRLNVEEQRSGDAGNAPFSTSMRDALPFAPAMPPMPELPPEPAADNAAAETVAEPTT